MFVRGVIIDKEVIGVTVKAVTSHAKYQDAKYGLLIIDYFLWTLNSYLDFDGVSENNSKAGWYYEN